MVPLIWGFTVKWKTERETRKVSSFAFRFAFGVNVTKVNKRLSVYGKYSQHGQKQKERKSTDFRCSYYQQLSWGHASSISSGQQQVTSQSNQDTRPSATYLVTTWHITCKSCDLLFCHISYINCLFHGFLHSLILHWHIADLVPLEASYVDQNRKMKGSFAILCCLAVASGFVLKVDEEATQWKAWKAFHGKSYATETEEAARRAIWRDNLKVKGDIK